MPNYKIDDVDFFAEANLTEAARTDTVAYLIDKEPACTTLEQGPYRQVTIKNPLGLSYQFVPIDHNIVIYRDNGEMASTCDGMLHYGGRKNVFFVELKDRSGDWIDDAVSQLGNTIEIFSQQHPHNTLGKKRAYAANRQHLAYQSNSSHKELYDKFRNKYHYRLSICGIIDVK